MRRMSRAAGALKTALGRRGSIRSKILAGFTVILVGMLSINLLVIGLSHHFLGEYHILAERVISANKLIPTVRDDVSLDAYYLVAGRRTLETTQLFHHMEEIRQGLYLLKQENNSENGRIQLQIATRTFGTLQRYCQKLGQEIDADVSLELQNVTLEQIRDVSALVYNQIEEYIYLELLWGESIDQMLQTGFQLLLLGDLAAVVLMVAGSAFYDMTIAPSIVALICMAQSGAMGWMYRKHIDIKQIALPIGVYTVCSLVIINLLGRFDLHVLTALFGAFLMALAAYFLFFAKRVKMQPSLTAGLVCSAFSGCCAGAFTIGGPMMALYFVAIARDKETYVGNMQFLFMVTNLINFTMRAVRGYFRAELLPVAGVSIVCILAGLWIGTRLSRRMSGDVARQVVYIGVGVSGLVTLAQELLK